MNARSSLSAFAFAAFALSGISPSFAQKVTQEPQEDPVQRAIREFKNRDSGTPNEVTVVLDPVGTPPAVVSAETKSEPVADAAMKADQPVLVTGTPPDEAQLIKETPAAAAPDVTAEPATDSIADTPAPEPRKGLSVRVEKLQTGTGNIDPTQVKLLAPFPAKPLADAPAGWLMESSENAPPFTREVELSPGNKITLTIRPHLLVPAANGADVFQVSEPGFDASMGYHQDATVGAVLSHSIRQLDEDSKQLGAAIDNLQQLLVSLPKEEIKPAPKPETNRKR